MEASGFDPMAVVGPLLVVFGIGVVAFIMIRGGRNPSPNTEIPMPVAPPLAGMTPDQEIQHLIAQGNKIQAIKRVREMTGMGLKEAKDYVDAYPAVTPLANLSPAPSSSPTQELAPLDEEIRALLARGNKIEAIKQVRERTGLGLKEAKDYVEALEAKT